MLVDYNFSTSASGTVVLALLSSLTFFCLFLAVYNLILIIVRHRKQKLINSIADSTESLNSISLKGSELGGSGGTLMQRNRALVTFYFFSILSLSLSIPYYLRFISSLYHCLIIETLM